MRFGTVRTLEEARGYVAKVPIPKEATLLRAEAETRIGQPLGRATAAMSEVRAALGAALEQRDALGADPD